MYVSLEGIDTAGKSTQLEILKNKYSNAIITKEPGGTNLGDKLRKIILNGEVKSSLAEMFLFLADRAEHTQEVIKNNKNKIIISDRSLISGIAYAKEVDIEKLIELNLLATSNILPTHIVLLELTKEELNNRLINKKNDVIESRGINYLMNIQDNMKEIIKKLNINYIFIDAKLPIKTIENLIEDFLNVK